MSDPTDLSTPVPFVILLPRGRCGSTHLVALLSSHPDIRCEGEVFDIAAAWPPLRGDRFAAPGSAIAYLRELYRTPVRAAGFKMKFPEQFQAYPDIIAYLRLHAPHIRVIGLYRENLLKQAISGAHSLALHQQTGAWNVTTTMIASAPRSIHIDVEHVCEFLDAVHAERQPFLDIVCSFPEHMLLRYEDLGDAQRQRELLSFLHVEDLPLSSSCCKYLPDDLASVVENYAELCERLEGTPFSCFLGSDETESETGRNTL